MSVYPGNGSNASQGRRPPRQRRDLPEEFRTQRPSTKLQTGATLREKSTYQLRSLKHDADALGRPDVLPNSGSYDRPSTTTMLTPEASDTWSGGPILKSREPWQDWPELSIKLHNVPPTISTWHLWKRFEREGTVTFIEIYEKRRGARDGTARIRFSPVPHRAFWCSQPIIMNATDGQGLFQVRVEAEPRKRHFQVQSPVKKGTWYPETMVLTPSAIDFGLTYSENTMMSMYTAPSLSRSGTTFTVDLLRRRITASFQILFKDPQMDHQKANLSHGDFGRHDRINKYMFQIPLNHVQKVSRIDTGVDQWAFIISLDSPPQFFKKRLVEHTHSEESLIWKEFDSWFRQTDIVYDHASLRKAAVSLDKETAIIDIGRWTTYSFQFDKNREESGLYAKVKSALQDFNIEVAEGEPFSIVPRRQTAVWPLIDSVGSNTNCLDLDVIGGIRQENYYIPFEVRYQLEVCISNGILSEHNITPKFIKTLAELASSNSTKARSMLESIESDAKRIYDPMTLFDNQKATTFSPRTKIPEYCALSRKVTVTPSTIYLSTPTVEITNRVIREYRHFGDRFLRVQFTDEKFQGRISPCADKVRNDEIFTRVYRTLFNGIRIGGRHYQFLAFGNSQFRENGAYFFCPTDQMTCAQIRKWMGDFSNITVVAKCAARLGLCFSTTRAITGKVQMARIDDVERNGYCFTDGVGKISPVLATLAADELGTSTSSIPSVFQFRMGGCKGILVISPDLKGQQVSIRNSQRKFSAAYNGLEIIRCSRFSAATLNRQTITILSSLGVPDEVFNRMLTEQVSQYHLAITNKSDALKHLADCTDENNTTVTLATMIMDGFMSAREPFVMSLLHLWRAWSIKLLKEKARIIVKDGAFLMGCTDETCTLRGHVDTNTKVGDRNTVDQLPQIFVQIPDKDKTGNYVIIEGICIIGRNPSLHPGDIRIVQAIDVPTLHHLKDVVVFPQLGDRDIPSMCSGGDLDGDDFFVLWDPQLCPQEWNCAPMDYSPPKTQGLDRQVEVGDMVKFFVRYMKNDALPTIAHAHMALCDFTDLGVKDPKCIELAHLHSKAVDYVKTGEPAEIKKQLRPRLWPHFMEKKHKSKDQVYRSDKILGQLYDKVDIVDFVPQYEDPFDLRILKAYPLDQLILRAARKLKTKHDTAVRRIMAQHEIKSEFEIWSTFVLSKPRVGTDYKLQETMGNIARTHKDQFRRVCIEQAGGDEFNKLGPFVAAMYRVTYEEMQIALHECRTTITVGGKKVPKRKLEAEYMPLISFPWLFHDTLGRIATGVADCEELRDLGLPFLTVNTQSRALCKSSVPHVGDVDAEDFVKTSNGITHRGEVLDLFKSSDIDSEGDDVEQPHERLVVSNNRAYINQDSERSDHTDSNVVTSQLTSSSRYNVSASDLQLIEPSNTRHGHEVKCLEDVLHLGTDTKRIISNDKPIYIKPKSGPDPQHLFAGLDCFEPPSSISNLCNNQHPHIVMGSIPQSLISDLGPLAKKADTQSPVALSSHTDFVELCDLVGRSTKMTAAKFADDNLNGRSYLHVDQNAISHLSKVQSSCTSDGNGQTTIAHYRELSFEDKFISAANDSQNNQDEVDEVDEVDIMMPDASHETDLERLAKLLEA